MRRGSARPHVGRTEEGTGKGTKPTRGVYGASPATPVMPGCPGMLGMPGDLAWWLPRAGVRYQSIKWADGATGVAPCHRPYWGPHCSGYRGRAGPQLPAASRVPPSLLRPLLQLHGRKGKENEIPFKPCTNKSQLRTPRGDFHHDNYCNYSLSLSQRGWFSLRAFILILPGQGEPRTPPGSGSPPSHQGSSRAPLLAQLPLGLCWGWAAPVAALEV